MGRLVSCTVAFLSASLASALCAAQSIGVPPECPRLTASPPGCTREEGTATLQPRCPTVLVASRVECQSRRRTSNHVPSEPVSEDMRDVRSCAEDDNRWLPNQTTPLTLVAVPGPGHMVFCSTGAPQAAKLTRAILDQSLQAGRTFMLKSQLPAGDFRYHVDFVTGHTAPEQSPVRQAGALWGVALIHHDQPTEETRQAVLRGIAFFEDHSTLGASGGRYIRFPGAAEGDSGAVALVALALIEFLRVEPAEQHLQLRQQLDEYLTFLTSLRRSDHRFYRQYLLRSGEGWGQSSPYFDGEILLALAQAARYLDRGDLAPDCLRSAEAMYQAYAQRAVSEKLDDDDTKGFFQWGCLAFAELFALDRANPAQHAQRAISLAHWMIDVHQVTQRRRNTGYAQEGIISAYHLALEIGDTAAASQFRPVIEQELTRLTSWQVGGPLPCPYLQQQAEYEASCRGGVLGADESPWLRIDTTQHQMHAVMLARRFVWPEE